MKPTFQSLFICLLGLFFLLNCSHPTESISDGECSHFILSDGRTISYMEYGPVDGFPVLYFHGFPGSHKDIQLFKGRKFAEDLQLRFITVNRPGYGESGSKPGRRLADWPKDVRELAGFLNISKYSILGYSGGGPFALACASEMPDQIHRVGIVSGMGPWEAPGSKKGMAMTIPRAPKLILKGMKGMLEKKPEKMEANMKKNMPEMDLAIMEKPGMTDAFLATVREGLKNGIQGAYDDARIYKKAWGINLTDIEKPVYLWHGTEDLNVRIETARYIADQLQHCEPSFIDDEGHLSLIANHTKEILLTLSEE